MSTIMFVDDEEMILDLLQEYMSQAYGYDVIIAHGGVKAVERYKKQWKEKEIDLVVLDMMMPDLNGCQVYEEMKKVNPNIHAIVMSGYCPDDMKQSMMKYGCKFLQKPVMMDVLHDEIMNVMKQVG